MKCYSKGKIKNKKKIVLYKHPLIFNTNFKQFRLSVIDYSYLLLFGQIFLVAQFGSFSFLFEI